MSDWRAMPKVCQARTGAANTKRYTSTRIEGTLSPAAMPDAEELGECMWCSEPATRLCDTMLRGRDWRGNLDIFQIDGPTCDAAMCEHHAGPGDMVFGHGESGGWSDTVDACPYCKGRGSELTQPPLVRTTMNECCVHCFDRPKIRRRSLPIEGAANSAHGC